MVFPWIEMDSVCVCAMHVGVCVRVCARARARVYVCVCVCVCVRVCDWSFFPVKHTPAVYISLARLLFPW